jgi:hypothetical protein
VSANVLPGRTLTIGSQDLLLDSNGVSGCIKDGFKVSSSLMKISLEVHFSGVHWNNTNMSIYNFHLQ